MTKDFADIYQHSLEMLSGIGSQNLYSVYVDQGQVSVALVGEAIPVGAQVVQSRSDLTAGGVDGCHPNGWKLY